MDAETHSASYVNYENRMVFECHGKEADFSGRKGDSSP